jgi:hypothetical protein
MYHDEGHWEGSDFTDLSWDYDDPDGIDQISSIHADSEISILETAPAPQPESGPQDLVEGDLLSQVDTDPMPVIGPPVVNLALASQIGPPVVPPTHGPVRKRFKAIIGSEVRQKELIAIRNGLFADILPPMGREEKRKLCENLVAFESHREEVLARLNNPAYVYAVLNEVLLCRTAERDRLFVLGHAMRFHLL